MDEVVRFLTENPVQFLATAGLDGKPRVRPFQYMLEHDGKLWFCTGNKKEVYAELQKNPYVELSENELVRSIYKSADNPEFEVFYLAEGKAVLANFSGQPPRTLTL